MRRRNTELVGDVLKEWIGQSSLQRSLKEMEVKKAWILTMNERVQPHVKRLYFRDNVLRVYLNSVVLVQELSMCRSRISTLLNQQLGEEVVKDVVFSLSGY